MNRLLALLVALALFAVACGGSDDGAETSSDIDATTAITATEDAASVAVELASADTTVEEPVVEEVPEFVNPEPLEIEQINVAYFEQWPTPNLAGIADGSFDERVGATINWIPLGSGGEMSAAMEAGEVDISFGQGLTPFANTVNEGADIKVVGIAVVYAEADNCVAQSELRVTRANAFTALDGATIMTPSGNVTHYKMLAMMDFLGVDIGSLNIVPTDSGAMTAEAFAAGDIDVGCSFGGSMVDMLETSGGNLIMTGIEQAGEIGVNTYDIVSIPASFGEEHPQAVINFLRATQAFNDEWAADPAGLNGEIASASGMDDVGNFLAGPTWFSFPTLEDQLSDVWLGDVVARNMAGQIQKFVDLGQIDSTIGYFNNAVDVSYLEAAIG